MRSSWRIVAVLFFACYGQNVLAQGSISLTSVGYSRPQGMQVAPGQVVTFVLAGAKLLDSGSAVQQATQIPLPTVLAGFSATLSQQPANKTWALPIFAVEQINLCDPSTPSVDCVITRLTVQIPFDLVMYWQLQQRSTVVISDGAGVSRPFKVVLLPENVHIVTDCDSSTSKLFFQPAKCPSIVTHANGDLVSVSNPAHFSEQLVMYALGLGPTSPTVRAGTATPVPAPTTVESFGLSFAYTAGALPVSQSSPPLGPNPVFVGLTPFLVGLYQVNFTVPAAMSPTADCSGQTEANLTVTLLGGTTHDTAEICVDTNSASAAPASDPQSRGSYFVPNTMSHPLWFQPMSESRPVPR